MLPVDQDRIDATLPHLGIQYRAMVKIQLLMVCRPGELVTMRPRESDRSESVWVYRPRLHKTMHLGKDRIIPIGPRAQLLLKPWLPDDPDQFVFRNNRGHAIAVGAYNPHDRPGVRKGRSRAMVTQPVAALRSNPDSPASQLGCGTGNFRI